MSIVCAIDFETSGYGFNCACSLGLTLVSEGSVGESFYTLIKPPSRRVFFTEIHGLTWRDLKDQPCFGEIWGEAQDFIGSADFFVAHNAPFDRNVLHACLYDIGETNSLPFLCTLKGSRRFFKEIKKKGEEVPRSKSLSSVCDYFHIPLSHHHAGSDALACAQIYVRLREFGLTEEDLLIPKA